VRLALLSAVVLAGCGDPSYPGQGFELRILPDSLTVEETLTAQLELMWVDEGGKSVPVRSQRAVWISGDESIASVSDGLVRALEVGRVQIVAMLDTTVARASVTVAVRFAAVASGDRACGVTQQGSLYCWDNPADRPDRIAAPAPVRSVTVGSPGIAGTQWFPSHLSATHACLVDTLGTAFCWGANGYGQLGDGTADEARDPVPVAGGLRVQAVTAGSNHSCGITVAGDAYCWGLNSLGELGIGQADYDPHPSPQLVVGGLRWTAITAGDGFGCGIADTQDVYCWGDGRYGVLGDGTSSGMRSEPSLVPGGQSWTHVDAGSRQVCAIDVRQDLYCWGEEYAGRIATTPERRDLQYYYRVVSTGGGETDDFVCAVTTTGRTYCWGGAHAQSGVFDRNRPPRPWAFVSVAAGALHACGLAGSGLVYCWGTGYGVEPQIIPYQLPASEDQSSSPP
jgi:alpha-tubulin suppressor-like RCC1 family protein